ncbi:ribosome biogenesis factor YjgA [Aquabacterium sp.]|jgi:ribosome-associated protein|uniref:ribosome biogenesis factor YjgA n=1 Tax=Aquabacterium sp. TaxID=1872578 RepID=UPI0025BED30F|nr:ribosome biogenesis factor YjgA [Aquabacterium sp.]
MNPNQFDQDEGFDPEWDDNRPPSKSMLKRESHELQELGKQLLAMPDSRLDDIEMPERLREALADWKKTKSFEGKRRQLQFIGKVMRGVDAEPLREAVAEFQMGHARNALELHQAERWRVELLGDDKDVVTRWAAEFPGADLQQLRALIRNARKDAAAEPDKRNGRAYREIFQYIKQVMMAQSAEAAQVPPAPAQDDDEDA